MTVTKVSIRKWTAAIIFAPPVFVLVVLALFFEFLAGCMELMYCKITDWADWVEGEPQMILERVPEDEK